MVMFVVTYYNLLRVCFYFTFVSCELGGKKCCQPDHCSAITVSVMKATAGAFRIYSRLSPKRKTENSPRELNSSKARP